MKIGRYIDKLLKGLVGIVFLVFVLFKFESFKDGIGFIFNIISPFLIGSIIALYLNVILVHIEDLLDRLIFNRFGNDKFKRPLAMLISVFIVILILVFALSIVLPTIRDTFIEISISLPSAARELMAYLYHLDLDIDIPPEIFNKATERIQSLINGIVNNLDQVLLGSLNIVTSTISVLFNLFLAFMFALYLLSGKEKISEKLKNILYAFLDNEHAQVIILSAQKFFNIFDNFMIGTLKEATLFVIANSILMRLLGLSHIFTVGVIVFFATFIPYFGPLFAGIIGSLLVATNGIKDGFIFLILYIVMQQIEANVVTPRLIGTEVGLPGILVMASATIFGALFGLVGMLMAVPITALIYYVLGDIVEYKLENKKGNNVRLSEVMEENHMERGEEKE